MLALVPEEPFRPFRLGDGPPCLLLHGFTGSPAELRPLGEALATAGFLAVAPCLPGHGASHGAPARREEWLRAAEAALLGLDGKVRVLGLSMGALLAISLSALWPDRVCSLALLAPAARLTEPGHALARAFARLSWLPRLVPTLPKRGSDLRDRAVKLWTGATIPTRGLAELYRLEVEARALAPRARAPALVLLGGDDRTVDGRAARALARELAGPVRVRVFPKSGHQLAVDLERTEVARAVAAHFRSAPG